MGKTWDNFGGRVNSDAERDRNAANRGPGAGLGNQPFGYSGSALPKTPKDRSAFVDFLMPRLAECLRLAKPGSRMLCWAIPRTSHWTGLAIEDAGWIIEDRVSHLFGSGFPKGKSKLKPACEDWWMARKPSKKVLPLNIDACRVPTIEKVGRINGVRSKNDGWDRPWRHDPVAIAAYKERREANAAKAERLGRWPANLIHDGSDEVVAGFPVTTSGGTPPLRYPDKLRNTYGSFQGGQPESGLVGSSGSAARFFYCAKASKSDRGDDNTHPTVKSQALMRYLCRLITPPNGLILDPFMGSGSTGVAALVEGFCFIGIERDKNYFMIAESRLASAVSSQAEMLNLR